MAQHWPVLPLGQLTTKIGSGATPRGGQNSYKADGITLIRSLNVYDLRFQRGGLAFIDDTQAAELSQVEVKKDDVLLNITGASVARCCVVPNDLLPARVNQHVAILRPEPSKLHAHYLAFLLVSPRQKSELLSVARAGATREALTKGGLERLEIPVPPIQIQRRIASILSAYDDLIENNARRIAILEETARRVFEEWFVQLRFPENDGKELRESDIGRVPTDWQITILKEVLAVLEAGSRPKGGIVVGNGEVPSIGAENINGLGKYDYGKEKLIPGEFFAKMRRGVIKSGDVLLYKDGAHIGRKAHFRDGYPYETCAVNEHVFVLRPKEEVSPAYLYFWLDQDVLTAKIRGLNANAAQPGINQRGVYSLPVAIPPRPLMKRFTETVEPLLAMLFSLAKAEPKLQATRDLLLPKLISGEIEVGAIEAPKETEAA